MTKTARTLLLNWIYYRPVGHAVEAFAAAADYYAANPDLEIHVLLNDRTPVELADYCPWVKKGYPIDVEDVAVNGPAAACLKDVPREWDYIVYSERLVNNPRSYSDALIRSHEVVDDITTARLWRGVRGELGHGSQAAPNYIPAAAFRMKPPAQAKAWARQFDHDAPICAVLLGGSSSEPLYPRIDWWNRLFGEMSHAFPGIRFLVTGATDTTKGRTTTGGISTEDLQALFAATPNAGNCYDVGLSNQLALLELADFFISPHTGFAFLAPCVGTPWLAISGGRWPDPTYAGTPFYAALPTCPEYPCWSDMLPACRERLKQGLRPPCMDSDLDDRIEDVVAGARLLMSPDFDLGVAARTYEKLARQKGIRMDRLYTLDMLRYYKALP